VTSDQVRSTFLEFFQARGHHLMPSSSLVPLNDPTVLLTPAGMHQMQPFFLGKAKPPANRLTSSQKCFRTTDIESVGDESHLTFFEMLGNFSVGDYFKEGAIEFAWELLRKGYGLPDDKLHVTCHPSDEEAPAMWRKIGVPRERIHQDETNWWAIKGSAGPCGPSAPLERELRATGRTYPGRRTSFCGREPCFDGPSYNFRWSMSRSRGATRRSRSFVYLGLAWKAKA